MDHVFGWHFMVFVTNIPQTSVTLSLHMHLRYLMYFNHQGPPGV